MDALDNFQSKMDPILSNIHKTRRGAVWRAIEALLSGGKLWLTALGRNLPSETSDKNSIKSLDRLLGNALLYVELNFFYMALCQVLLRQRTQPVILVDITEIRPGLCALTAAIAHDGRSLPIYHMVRSKSYIARRKCKQAFLEKLAQILPTGVIPILVTDAGFQSPWLDDVNAMGWNYVARIRHRTNFLYEGDWKRVQDLHLLAKNRAQNLGPVAFPKSKPKARRLVLAKEPKNKGRKRKTSTGKTGRHSNDKRCQKSAREPWLLATSLSCAAAHVVEIYALRMQIEQNYRDFKNHRWGWELSFSRSRPHRLEILLLLGALGAAVVQSVGVAGEAKQLQWLFQANTERKRRVLSFFVLGTFLLKPKNMSLLTKPDILGGLLALSEGIRTLETFT